jgi:hypothetical protein
MLGALANNGGPTQTRLPLTGSPLIDAIPNAAGQTAPLVLTARFTGLKGWTPPRDDTVAGFSTSVGLP